jgi:hypothetical protein
LKLGSSEGVLIAQQNELRRSGRCSGQLRDGSHGMRDTNLNRALILLAGMIGGALMAALQTRLLEL